MKSVFAIILIFLSFGLKAQDFGDFIKSAEAAYHSGDFKKSAENYEAAFRIKSSRATDYYNAACSWALSGNKEKAVENLNIAIDKGWINISHTKQDKDLEILRESVEWKAALNKMEDKLAILEKDINKSLKAELELIKEQDQRHRNEMTEVSKKYGWKSPEMDALWVKQSLLDSINMLQVEKILAKYGYPGKEMVGQEQSNTVFLVIQHADLEIQKKYLPLLLEAADKGQLFKGSVAMVIDRINMRENKPQIYGSQLRQNPETGVMEFYTIEDEKNVNKRRAEVGLQPIEEYAKMFEIEYQPPKEE